MADPFGTLERKSTASQWVAGGSFGHPMPRDWNLENAIVHGYRASGWVYSCATILAKHISEWPWKTWIPRDDGSDDLQIEPGHPAAALIETPNARQTRRFQMWMRTLHICLGGEALDKIVTTGARRRPTSSAAVEGFREIPSELWPMRPDSVRAVASPTESVWLDHWRVTPRGVGRKELLDPAVVCHAQLPDPADPFRGMSPLRAIGKPVDMDVAQVTWNRELMENDGSPAGVFSDPAIRNETDLKLAKERLKVAFSGPLHARDPLVLGGEAKWQQLGISPRELDWVESRKFTVGEICTAFGLLTARFTTDAQTYSNLDAAIEYEVENGALPIAGIIGDGLALSLLTMEERRAGMRILPQTSNSPIMQRKVFRATEAYVKLVAHGIPKQTAAGLVNLPVSELPLGERVYMRTNLQDVTDQEGEP